MAMVGEQLSIEILSSVRRACTEEADFYAVCVQSFLLPHPQALLEVKKVFTRLSMEM
jgi:hypothetical protein